MGFSDWAELPKDLLDSVSKRLESASDYVRFSIVCMSWNSVAKMNLSKRGRHPLLMTYTGKEETWNLCNVRNDKVLNLQLELPNKRYCGFSKGWLITMDEKFVVTLINPLTNVKGRKGKENSIIGLPALKPPNDQDRTRWAKQSDTYIVRATISADPISNAKDCIVLVTYEEQCRMALIRLDKDTTWTYIYSGVECIQDVIYVEDKFFAVDILNQLHSFAVTTQFESRDVDCVAQSFEQDETPIIRYLVELSSQKELLMVQRYISLKPGPRKTAKFEVFKFDAGKYKWTKTNTIGDVALFVGENSSISLSASNFVGYLPNCIYFLHDWDRVARTSQPRDFGLYNIKTRRFLPIAGTLAASLIKMSDQTPIWIEENIKL